MLILRPKRWTQKPPIGAQINWSHPLARGLVAYFPISEGGGLRCFDLTGAAPGVLSGSAPYTVGPNGSGMSFAGRSVSNLVLQAYRSALNSSKLTVAVSFSGYSNSSFAGLAFRDYDGSTVPFSLDMATANVDGGFAYYNAGWTKTGIVANVFDSLPHQIVGTADGTNLNLYADGKFDSSVASAGCPTSNVTSGLTFGKAYSGAVGDGIFYWVGMWNRALTRGEVSWLNAEPYAFLISQSPRIRIFKPATTGTTFTGSGGLSETAAAESGTGKERFIGTGGETETAAAEAGTAKLRFIATGGLSETACAISGTAAEKFKASGGLSETAAAESGTGAERFIASGSLTETAAAESGTGTERFIGSGGLSETAAAEAGTGALAFVASGNLTEAAAAQSGAGVERFIASGDLTEAPAAIAGTGVNTASGFIGTGDLTEGPATMAGTGTNTPPTPAPVTPGGVAVPYWMADMRAVGYQEPRLRVSGSGGMRTARAAMAAAGSVLPLAFSGTGGLTVSIKQAGEGQTRFAGVGAMGATALIEAAGVMIPRISGFGGMDSGLMLIEAIGKRDLSPILKRDDDALLDWVMGQ